MIEPIETYCSDSTYFEYYIDYTVSFDPYIGNIKDDPNVNISIYPGCMDEIMFNYDDNANVNQLSLEEEMDPCYPIVYGCLDESAANFNNYYSSLNTNPQTGLTYDLGDIDTSRFWSYIQGQDSVFTNYYNMIILVMELMLTHASFRKFWTSFFWWLYTCRTWLS